MNCPKCGSEMSRCEKGHLHGPDIFNQMKIITGNRGEKEPHWYCGDGSHLIIELFDDGTMEEF